jgi:hypothetical protein
MIIYILFAILVGYYKQCLVGFGFVNICHSNGSLLKELSKNLWIHERNNCYKMFKFFFFENCGIYQTLIVQNLKFVGMNPKNLFKT